MTVSITKELRKLADEADKAGVLLSTGRLRDIADRIDAAHEEGMRKAYVIGSAIADDWYADKTDDDLSEHGLVRLPVDADGETWHLGDFVLLGNGDESHVNEVVEMYLGGKGWWLKTVNRTGATALYTDIYNCNQLRHYKPTPAERIREIVESDIEPFTYSDDGGSTYERPLKDVAAELLAIADELEADHE